jgi:hypothetical protein
MNAFRADDDRERSSQRAPVARTAAARLLLPEFAASGPDNEAPRRCKHRRRACNCSARLIRLNAGPPSSSRWPHRPAQISIA